MKKILILFGGASYEHNVSCQSAKTILDNIDRKRYVVEATGIDKDNNWYIFNDDSNLLLSNWQEANTTKITNIPKYLSQFDKVFPIIHGAPLENGILQGLLELFNIDYVGSNEESSILSYDKELTKIIMKEHNINIVPSITINKLKKIKNIPFDFPVIIKPARCGSSIGINIANNMKELNNHLKIAYQYDNKVIIEKYIKSRELECAILEDKKMIVSPVGEIKSSHTFYDYDAKYNSDSSLIIPAKIDKKLTTEIQKLSLEIAKILSLKNLSRIDFLYDYNSQILYFNEVNTMPGFTTSSMYPLLFNHLSITTKDLITKLIEN